MTISEMGKKGGQARMAKLSAEERIALARKGGIALAKLRKAKKAAK